MPGMSSWWSLPFRVSPRASILCGLVALASGVTGATVGSAQQAPARRVFNVRETAGISRTQYPVSVTVQIPRGALTDTTHARVMTNSGRCFTSS